MCVELRDGKKNRNEFTYYRSGRVELSRSPRGRVKGNKTTKIMKTSYLVYDCVIYLMKDLNENKNLKFETFSSLETYKTGY